jgi:hypothetical protein
MPAEAAELTFSCEGDIGSNQISDIEEIVSEYGFNIHSDAVTSLVFQPFENTEENKKLVEACVAEVESEFPDLDIKYGKHSNKDPGKRVSRIFDIKIIGEKGVSNDTTDDSDDYEWRRFNDSDDGEKKRVRAPRTQSTDDVVSTDPDDRGPDWASNIGGDESYSYERKKTGSKSTEKDQEDNDGQTATPETVAQWKMWYPCPACHSTSLTQIIESNLAVSATEDGSYGGESSVGEYNYVECSNCGEVLLDEIGKS